MKKLYDLNTLGTFNYMVPFRFFKSSILSFKKSFENLSALYTVLDFKSDGKTAKKDQFRKIEKCIHGVKFRVIVQSEFKQLFKTINLCYHKNILLDNTNNFIYIHIIRHIRSIKVYA